MKTRKVLNLPISQTLQRQDHHSGLLFLKSPSVATCGYTYEATVNTTGLRRDRDQVDRQDVHSLPGVNQPWVIYCAPAEIFYFGNIRRLLVELAHGL